MDRLTEGALVSISLPTEDLRLRMSRLLCHVVAIADGVAALEPLGRADARRLPDELDSVYMGFRHKEMLVGLQGRLYKRDGDLRFSVSDGVHVPRQRATRLKLTAPVTVRRADPPAEVESLTVNLSVDGMLAESELVAQVGETLRLTFSLPGFDAEMNAEGRVVRCADGLIAMQFTQIDRRVRGRIGAFIFEGNRDLYRRGRDATIAEDEFVF